MGRFLEEQCRTGHGLQVPMPALYDAYEKWARGLGLPPVGQFLFGLKVGDLGFHSEATGTHSLWLDLELNPG